MTLDDQTALESLRRATQSLALDGEQQLGLFPDFVDKPFELLDDFDNWYGATRWRTSLAISSQQAETLREVLDAITSITEASYTDSAVRDSTEWALLRSRARAALAAFGWPLEAPDASSSAYVRAR